jgi:hypothetical protein
MAVELQNGDWMKEMVTAQQLVAKRGGKSVRKEGGTGGIFNHDDVTLRPELSQTMTILDDRNSHGFHVTATISRTSSGQLSRAGDLGVHQLVQTRRADYSISKQTEQD